MNIRPLNKKVIIEPQSREVMTKGGIIIPETANQKAPTQGLVMAISNDSELKAKGQINIGDTVLFSKYAGTEIVIPRSNVEERDQMYLVVPETDILAVICCENRKGD